MRYRTCFSFLLLILCGSLFHLGALTKDDIPIIPYKKNNSQHRKVSVSICALFKSEAAYLKEWIEYHRLIGVDHFYLYNNCSTDDYMTVLKSYIKEGTVELFDVPIDSSLCHDGATTHNLVQKCCYNHAIKLSAHKSKWLAIIDSDEFICPVKTKNLPKCLHDYDYASGVVAYWQIYGTSWVKELLPKELLLEKLIFKAPPNSRENWLFKSIVKPERAYCNDPHWTKVIGTLVAPNHSSFSHTPVFKELPVDTLRINHYTFRTEDFYFNVKAKRRADWGFVPSPEEEAARIALANSVYDPTMLRFVPELKKRLFQSNQ